MRPQLISELVTVDGCSVHTRLSIGPVPAGRPPVVLIHGLVVSSRYMEPTAQWLAGETRVYAPDLPGYGRSDKPPGTSSVQSLAEALARWWTTLDLAPAIVVANSFGCQIAAQFAADHPEHVQRLVLLGPMVDPRARNPLKLAALGFANIPHEPPSLGAIILRDLIAMGLPRTLALIWAMLTHRIEDVLPDVHAPTLVVRGELDPMVSPAWTEHLAKLPRRGASLLIPEAGHALNYNAAAKVAAIVTSILNESQPAALVS